MNGGAGFRVYILGEGRGGRGKEKEEVEGERRLGLKEKEGRREGKVNERDSRVVDRGNHPRVGKEKKETHSTKSIPVYLQSTSARYSSFTAHSFPKKSSLETPSTSSPSSPSLSPPSKATTVTTIPISKPLRQTLLDLHNIHPNPLMNEMLQILILPSRTSSNPSFQRLPRRRMNHHSSKRSSRVMLSQPSGVDDDDRVDDLYEREERGERRWSVGV